MAARSTRADARRFLRQRGFEPVASRAVVHTFEGPLKLSSGEVRARLDISDWEFITYPNITLIDRPSFLPSLLSHIDANGGLCYLVPGSLVLDRFDPAGSIALCLQSAESLLNDIVANPKRNELDIQDEFLAYWGSGSRTGIALIGDVPDPSPSADVYVLELDEQRSKVKLCMISSSPREFTQISRVLGGKLEIESRAKCWIVSTKVYPTVTTKGLPSSLGDLFRYLKNWDPVLSQQVQKILSNEKQYLQRSIVTFAVRSPAGWLGFSFSIKDFRATTGFRQLPSVCLQYLHRNSNSIKVTRLSIMQTGARYIHTRNLSHESLIDKRVTLVGCGAIGGYAAQALARLGAGAGKGELRLIDHGILEPGNLGRHWLGMEALLLPKAVAVARALRLQFPMSNFAEYEKDVREVPNIFGTDLLIDCTGVESISEMINAHHLSLVRKRPPVLYAWILGNGDCIQGLWVDSERFGCYRCLRQPDGSNYRAERFPVLKHAPTTRMIGCQAVTPYAVASPMEAAALVTEFVSDWLKGSVSPRLRHRFRHNADVRHQKSQDMSKMTDCPACTAG